MKKETLSVIIPCYNEAAVIGDTVRRLNNFCSRLPQMGVELIFVDDGSSDSTRDILKAAAREDARVKIICLSRNFGHQIAVTAGMDAAGGDAVVIIDADLQDPPEVIHQMIGKWQEGYDVVYGTRTERPGESVFKLSTSKGFYRILNQFSSIAIPLDTGDFRLMDRKVVDALRAMPERDRFIRGMVCWVGFRQTSLTYKRAERSGGVSKYPLKKMLHFAMDGILSFSTKPLQISIGLGLLTSFLAMIGIVYVLYVRIFTSIWVPGWTMIMVSLLFLGGVQLISIGIMGEYVGRIYNEVKRRPLYVVSESIGFETGHEA